VSTQVNEKISKFTNTSKTADVSKAAELLGGLWIHPTGTIAAIAGTRGAAHLLSRPAVAQAAVRLGRAQLAGSAARTALAHTALVNTIQAQLPTAGQQWPSANPRLRFAVADATQLKKKGDKWKLE
jgi:hypothetical protein